MATSDDLHLGNTPEELDHTPITFGMYSTRRVFTFLGYTQPLTPSQIAEVNTVMDGKDLDGEQYIRWMYDTVKNRPTCSELLARACGWKPPVGYQQARAEVKNQNNHHVKSTSWDDMDDDIPF